MIKTIKLSIATLAVMAASAFAVPGVWSSPEQVGQQQSAGSYIPNPDYPLGNPISGACSAKGEIYQYSTAVWMGQRVFVRYYKQVCI
jgi:hypothetical protein